MSTLPPRPSLKQLKKQARELLCAHRAGESSAAIRLGTHLPRLSAVAATDIAETEVSLQEAQHVIACEYGLKSWRILQSVVKPDFDLLASAEDGAIQVLTRSLFQQPGGKDLARALVGASQETGQRLLATLSIRRRHYLETEMRFLGDLPTEETEAAQRLVMQRAAELAVAGELRWPSSATGEKPSSQEPATPATPRPPARLLDLLGRPVEGLSLDEIAETCQGLAEYAGSTGMQSLAALTEQICSPLIGEGVRAALDGDSPAMIEHLLEKRRMHSLLAASEKRGLMVVEAVFSMLCGDNPTWIRNKLEALYLAEDTEQINASQRDVSADHVKTCLRNLPASQMSLDELTAFLTDLGFVARNEGIASLAPLIDELDYPLLRHSLQLLVDSGDLHTRLHEPGGKAQADAFLEVIEWRAHDEVAEDDLRYQLVTAGLVALQAGKSPADVGDSVREAEGAVRARYLRRRGAAPQQGMTGARQPTAQEKLLKQTDLFSQLGDGQIRAVAAIGELRKLAPQEVLIARNSTIDEMYILLDGELALVGLTGQRQEVLDSPCCVGERSMLSGERTTAQVRAVTTAEVLAIGRDRLMSLAETDADLRFIVRTRSEVRVLVPSQMAVLTGE